MTSTSSTPAIPTTIQPIPPSEILAKLQAFEQTALARVLHWGPMVAAALILLGGIILLFGLLFGGKGWRGKGITIAILGPAGYLAAVAILHLLLFHRIYV